VADASSTLPSVLMGQPPDACNTRQNFDDAPALQQVVRESASASAVGSGRLEQRLHLMEHRIDASDSLMQEVHAMVREMRQDRQPAVSQSASSTMRWGGHSDIGDLVANWPHVFKAKHVYLVGMFVLLHVLMFIQNGLARFGHRETVGDTAQRRSVL